MRYYIASGYAVSIDIEKNEFILENRRERILCRPEEPAEYNFALRIQEEGWGLPIYLCGRPHDSEPVFLVDTMRIEGCLERRAAKKRAEQEKTPAKWWEFRKRRRQRA